MSITLKFIKKKEFEVEKVKHVHYTTGYKGRVIAVSTMNIPADDITADATTVVVKGDIEVVNRPWADPLTGDMKSGLVLVPQLGLNISAF